MLKKFLILSTIVAITVGCGQDKSSMDQPNPLLLISFDGFRYDYLSKAETPNFDEFITGGVQANGLISVFPSKTFPSHYSIATGLYPENSGLVGNTMYDPEFNEWYRIGDRRAVENKKWYNGEPIWNTAEKQGLKAGTMFWVGSEAPIQNMRPTHWKFFDGAMSFKTRIDTVVKWLSAPEGRAVDFATLYFEHVDYAGHRYGVDSDSVKAAIQQSDELMRYLKMQLQANNVWNDTNIMVVSDHGMIDQSAEKIIELDKIINPDNLKRAIKSPVTMLQPRKGKAAAMYKALKNNEKHYRVYKKEDLPERYHFKNNRRVFDFIMVANPGYTIVDADYKPRFLKLLPRATHGYDPNTKAMQAFFAARGPAFKEDTTVSAFQSIHLYELMTELLRLEPATNDGSLDSVKVMVKEP
jgi:predicted AlkP superfamily pyrophosphatase or phosphodiesterase